MKRAHPSPSLPLSPRLAFLGLLVATGLLTASCGDDQDPDGASDLLARMKSEDYRSWARGPGYTERRTSSAPHGDEVEIFVNDVAAQALQGSGQDKWPVGSIIAKDGYDEGGGLSHIAAMEKREDGWYWAEWDGETEESIYSGKPATCIDCHATGDDYVRAFGLP